jgi:hypothetical protein
MYELHGPTELPNNSQIGEFGHVGMRPGVDSDVMAERLKHKLEFRRVGKDVDTDNEMRGGLIVLLKELAELVGDLLYVS